MVCLGNGGDLSILHRHGAASLPCVCDQVGIVGGSAGIKGKDPVLKLIEQGAGQSGKRILAFPVGQQGYTEFNLGLGDGGQEN